MSGDIDGDGSADLVWVTASGDAQLVQGGVDNSGAVQLAQKDSYDTYLTARTNETLETQLSDLNDDGRSDLVRTVLDADGVLVSQTVRFGEAGQVFSAEVEVQSETIEGTTADDVLSGPEFAVAYELIGGLGSDTLTGNTGADLLNGGAGDDALIGGAGGDLLDGGAGSDDLVGGDGLDTLIGGLGDDLLDGGQGEDALVGGFGDDVLAGGAGDDVYVFELGDGLDTITDVGGGNDTVLFGELIDFDDLWVEHTADNRLEIRVGYDLDDDEQFADLTDGITVNGQAGQQDAGEGGIETLAFNDGTSLAVDQLINAIASFEPTGGGAVRLAGETVRDEVANLLAPAI